MCVNASMSMCMLMNEFIYVHVCMSTCMNSHMCVNVCVCKEEELSCCVLGERNLRKWSKERVVLGILPKPEIQLSWGQSLFFCSLLI